MTDRIVTIAIAKDGAHDFVSQSNHSLGEVGAFQTRVTRTRLGIARHLVMKISVSSPHKRDLLAAAIQMEAE